MSGGATSPWHCRHPAPVNIGLRMVAIVGSLLLERCADTVDHHLSRKCCSE